MLQNNFWYKTSTIGKLFNFIDTVFKKLFLPIRNNLPFFILFFLLITPTTFKSFIAGLLSFDLDPFIGSHFARALSLSYLLTIIIDLTHSKWLKVCFYVIGIILFSINIFLWLVFHLYVQPQIITFVFETNSREASEFLSTYLFSQNGFISIVILCLSISIVVFTEYKRANITNFLCKIIANPSGKIIQIPITLILLFGFYDFNIYFDLVKNKTMYDINNKLHDSFPLDLVTNMIFSLNTVRITNVAMHQAIQLSYHAQRGIITEKDSLNVVYIIGESYIKSHSSLYGYPLLTTPELRKEQRTANLYVFNDVISPFNYTYAVMKNTFCCNSLMDKEEWYEKPFFPTIFKKSGFNVYNWDIQRPLNPSEFWFFANNSFIFDPTLSRVSYTAAANKHFDYDDQLIEDFATTPKKLGKYNLVIFHLWGQHVDAACRYPHNKKFNHFTAKDIKRIDSYLTERKKQDIADYDNATYYNDYVVGHIIDLFRNSNSVIIYISDHGEEVYDYRDSKGRVNATAGQYKEFLKYQFDIPFMIWCSDIYKKRHPKIIKEIEAAQSKPFMSDNICQVFFHLSGLKTNYYIPKRDLLSPDFQIRERILGNGVNYDDIIKKGNGK